VAHVIDHRFKLTDTHRKTVMKPQERLMIETDFGDAALSGRKGQIDRSIKQDLSSNVVRNAFALKLVERLIEKMIGAASCLRISLIIFSTMPRWSCVVGAERFISHTDILFRKRNKIKKSRFNISGGS